MQQSFGFNPQEVYQALKDILKNFNTYFVIHVNWVIDGIKSKKKQESLNTLLHPMEIKSGNPLSFSACFKQYNYMKINVLRVSLLKK